MHKIGFLHLDIKPDNVLIGLKDKTKLCLIDFGISEKFLDNENQLIPRTDREHISGTLTFVSKFALEFKSQSRRDDLICMMYMIILFVNGNLPWKIPG